ncbi:MAG: hypothetical protein AAGF11_15550 [Myxococcota bacterium]
MKLETVNPDKFNVMSKSELEDQLVRRETREAQNKLEANQIETRLLPLDSNLGALAPLAPQLKHVEALGRMAHQQLL